MNLLSGENLMRSEFLRRSRNVQVISSPLIGMIDRLLRRGETDGYFRPAIDPLHLYVVMVALSYFHRSNAFTLSVIFATDLLDKRWQARCTRRWCLRAARCLSGARRERSRRHRFVARAKNRMSETRSNFRTPHDMVGAFCPHGRFVVPGAPSGPLSGLSFGAKDLFDVAGHVTGRRQSALARDACSGAAHRTVGASAARRGRDPRREDHHRRTGL